MDVRAKTRLIAAALSLTAAAAFAQPPGYPPGTGYYGPAPGGIPPAPGGYAPGYGGYGPAPGGYGPAPGGYGLPPGGYGPGPGGYMPNPSGYGPPPPGALDLDAPSFGGAQPNIDDPAFGPLPPRQYATMPPIAPSGRFSPDIPPHRPRSVRDYAWTYLDAPEPREIMLHDIITILVDEKAELLVQSRFNRQRNSTFKAELKEFMRLDDDLNLASAVQDGVAIDANLRGRMQSDGATTDREGVRYRIAATVVGVLPNGNVVLEARKMIYSNDGAWEYTLTGTIASRDIKNDYTAVSENVANLQIEKSQKGKIADSTQRTWGMWIYDKLSPF